MQGKVVGPSLLPQVATVLCPNNTQQGLKIVF